MRMSQAEALGGMDERFSEPGGGLVNLDFFIRACETDSAELILLLGEASFHQMHGGASTTPQDNFTIYTENYQRIRGRAWSYIDYPAIYYGKIPEQLLESLRFSVERMQELLPNAFSNLSE